MALPEKCKVCGSKWVVEAKDKGSVIITRCERGHPVSRSLSREEVESARYEKP